MPVRTGQMRARLKQSNVEDEGQDTWTRGRGFVSVALVDAEGEAVNALNTALDLRSLIGMKIGGKGEREHSIVGAVLRARGLMRELHLKSAPDASHAMGTSSSLVSYCPEPPETPGTA